MEDVKHCPICAKAVDASRLARYPSARTCGVRTCALEYRRVRLNFHRNKYVKKRLRTDPEFRQRKNQRQRAKYAEERLLLRKIAAHRPLVTNGRGAVDTLLSKVHEIAAAVLSRAARAFRGSKAKAEQERVQS